MSNIKLNITDDKDLNFYAKAEYIYLFWHFSTGFLISINLDDGLFLQREDEFFGDGDDHELFEVRALRKFKLEVKRILKDIYPKEYQDLKDLID